ncbi:MAG: homoserine dehydrogenase [Christensenellaceae bacterium]|nr:homoserine dehydrogenase [Christensenellaceae bacterium]
MKKVGVALLGLGTVGYGTYRILMENREYIKKNHGVDIEIKHILERNVERVKELGIDPKLVSTDINNVLKNPEIQIVAEFFGGIEPARSFLIASLKAGKSMVTANKEMLSKHWSEFDKAAREGKAGLYFEASCVGGVPIIRTLTSSLQGDKIISITGILNGTTNYILSKMTNEGLEYDNVLKEAQAKGYAEANPVADVDGYDSMYKLSILSTLAFHKKVPLDKITREGISKIEKIDIEYGKQFGYTLKLLAISKNINGRIESHVHPTFVKNDNPLASVGESYNAVTLTGSNVGDIMLYGRGAGDLPTGSAIVSDIVYCALQEDHKYYFDDETHTDAFESDSICRYYIRMLVCDKSGVLASIANIFGKYNISISSMKQKEPTEGYASLVFFTHEVSYKDVTKAIFEIEKLTEVKSVDAKIRLL